MEEIKMPELLFKEEVYNIVGLPWRCIMCWEQDF